jgi:transposase
LIARVAAVNDQTLEQLCQWVNDEHGVQVGVTTMWKTLARLGLSLKKRRRTQPSSSART